MPMMSNNVVFEDGFAMYAQLGHAGRRVGRRAEQDGQACEADAEEVE